MSATDTVELESLKSRLKSTWMAGNYDYFSRFMESSAAEFLARLPLGPGDHVLDVACGSGQLALLAARSGGIIGMANWTKEGFIGHMLQTIGTFVVPSGMPSPLLWGDEARVRERFANTVSNLQLTRVQYRFDYAFPPEGVVDFFRENYGPANRAFAALSQTDQVSLPKALVELWSGANQSGTPGRTTVDAEYLEVVATRA